MKRNPYAAPTAHGNSQVPVRRPRGRLSPGEIAAKFAVTGFVGGGLIGSLGYLAFIAAIESLLTPPFKSPPNYGQFMFVVIGVAFYMSMFGVCLGLVPYVTSIGYIPLHILGVFSIWSIDRQFFAEVDWMEAPIVAMILLLLSPTCAAVAFDIWASRLRSLPAQSNHNDHNYCGETPMPTRKDSNGIYRNTSIAATILGVVFCGVGFAMGGFTSVTWAGFIGAGIALVFHSLIAIGVSCAFPVRSDEVDTTGDAK